MTDLLVHVAKAALLTVCLLFGFFLAATLLTLMVATVYVSADWIGLPPTFTTVAVLIVFFVSLGIVGDEVSRG